MSKAKKRWVQPTAAETLKALGDISGLPAPLQKALSLDADSFPDLPPNPSPNDWLGCQPEPGQSYAAFDARRTEFRAVAPPSAAAGQPQAQAQTQPVRRTVFVHPVGDFTGPRCPDLRVIKRIAEAFFYGLTFEFLPPIDLPQLPGVTTRKGTGGQRQVLIGSLMEYLQHARTPHGSAAAAAAAAGAGAAASAAAGGGAGADAKTKSWPSPLTPADVQRELLSLVVTMHDVYPGEGWNFVYGGASPVDGVGLWSFARLDPQFPAKAKAVGSVAVTTADAQLILRRCTNVLLHETVHLFGIEHCIDKVCLINGANHEHEMDRQPMYLCPVCLRKFQSACGGFDVVRSFRALYAELTAAGLKADAQWYAARLTKMGFALTPTADELKAAGDTAAASPAATTTAAAGSAGANTTPCPAPAAAAAATVAAREGADVNGCRLC